MVDCFFTLIQAADPEGSFGQGEKISGTLGELY